MDQGDTEDLANLANLDEKVLLEELKARYFLNRIYTYVGDILVAFNPFQDLGLYGKNVGQKYILSRRGSQPPHIFAVSDAAYQSMRGMRGTAPQNQCILISGESGAGKTESTKLLIKHLVDLCHGNTQLEQQILQVNPLLEAFGNAQTMMNDNSSRFGKYIQLKFHEGQVIGAKISEYLLEKSRVIRQAQGEENFHVFYYMLAGLPDDKQKALKLKQPHEYRYLSNRGVRTDHQRELYEELLNALDMVGFTDEEQQDMFTILAGILALGNVRLDENQDGEVKVGTDDVSTSANLLGLSPKDLHQVLTCSITKTKDDIIRRNYTKAQALDSLDAVAKAVYGRLFSWIVNKINVLLASKTIQDPKHLQEIGILDIFGFEHFEKNSFEQACINLANEQLQFFFNRHVFSLEQEEYRREGVDWNEIKFKDNQELLDLFMARPIGLFALLDEESQFPNGTDLSFVDKLNMKFDDCPVYQKSNRSGSGVFTIVHYAGKVTYSADGWLEKNRDTMPPGVTELLQNSSNTVLSCIFRANISRTGTLALQQRMSKKVRKSTKRKAANYARVAKLRKLTVSHQFKNSLTVLMEKMMSSQPVFVRCIKPNSNKAARQFDDEYVTAQLLYTGMLETTKIRREGFAVRPTFQEFFDKYQLLVHQKVRPDAMGCHCILQKSNLEGWCIGKTKVFLKYWHVDKLSEKMEEISQKAVHLQRIVRGFLARRRVQRLKKVMIEEALQVAALLSHVQRLCMTGQDQQRRVVDLDQKISPDFFKKGALNDSETTATSVTEPAESQPLYMTIDPNATEEPIDDDDTDDDGDGDSSDNEILEDDFTPVKTTGALKFGGEGTRAASIRWFQQTQSYKLKDEHGGFEEWFHGIITRRESERLLAHKHVGCFLVRVSESRFGYSLSFRAVERCRHYMIDQTPGGKYIILGEGKVHRTLKDMVEYHQQHKLSNWDGLLIDPCGQEDGLCDYAELMNEDGYSMALSAHQRQPEPVAPPLPRRQVPASSEPNTKQNVRPPLEAYESLRRDHQNPEHNYERKRMSNRRSFLPHN